MSSSVEWLKWLAGRLGWRDWSLFKISTYGRMSNGGGWRVLWLRSRLEKGIPGVMDMERSAFVPWLKEQADENVLQVISLVDALGGPGQRPFSPAQRLLMGPLGFWVQYPMQAFYIKQIRLLHNSYDYLGKEAENIVDQFQHRPWSEPEAHLLDYDDREFDCSRPF